MKKVVMGNEAAALAAKLARVQMVSAYPITPQTIIVENLAEIIGRGELKAKYIPVESEHSAMASCIGASMAGARAFTASSSQGLAYMHEMLHYAAGARVPVVMVNCNRALTPPWNLYCDHTDSLAQRDTGWIQYYCADAQDVLDAILIAYACCRTGAFAGHDQSGRILFNPHLRACGCAGSKDGGSFSPSLPAVEQAGCG